MHTTDVQLLAAALETIDEAVGIYDSDDRLVAFNYRYAEFRAAIGGKVVQGGKWDDLVRESLAAGAIPEAKGREEEWLADRRRARGEYSTVRRLPDGRSFKINERRMAAGGIAVVWTEISDLVDAEERLHAALRDAICIADVSLDERFIRVNSAFCALLGYSSEELVGRSLYDLNHSDEKQTDLKELRRLLAGEIHQYSVERRLNRKDGSLISVQVTRSLVRTPAGQPGHFIAVLTDISSRQVAEAAASEREARLLSILDTAPEPLITIDEQGIVESFSRSSEELFGYSAAEVIGRNVDMLMPSPFREEHDGYLDRYRRTGEKRIIGIGRVVSARRKDGSIFPIELSVGEARIGDKRLFTGFIRDLTAKHRLEQELRQAQKMEAVGQLTGGIAHDFNNLLTVILGNLEMLELRLSDERQLMFLGEARETAELGAQLTRRLLAFGRRQPLAPKLTDPDQLIGEMTSLLRRTLGETIEVRTRAGTQVSKVLVDPGQLQNAILNLAINARDAMPNGGRLTIAVENTEIDPAYARQHAEVRPGRYVLISVSDTGTGMSPEVQDRAFEPFFTTKEVGAGSGLGLSMVYGFVKQSGGHVQLYSEIGHGTTVRLYIPDAQIASIEADSSAPTSLDALRARNETVLVVEDEPRVRRMTVTRLEDLGYHVLEAPNGPSALTLIKSHPEIDLLFTDMVMPGGMTGSDLADAAQLLRPDLKVLFTSGYAEPEIARKGMVQGAGWLKKPYTTIEFASCLRSVLGN